MINNDGIMEPAELRIIIKFLGDNQRTFARRLGVSEATVSNWLNEKRTMHHIFARQIRELAGKKQRGRMVTKKRGAA